MLIKPITNPTTRSGVTLRAIIIPKQNLKTNQKQTAQPQPTQPIPQPPPQVPVAPQLSVQPNVASFSVPQSSFIQSQTPLPTSQGFPTTTVPTPPLGSGVTPPTPPTSTPPTPPLASSNQYP
jgi:hypothetical protein